MKHRFSKAFVVVSLIFIVAAICMAFSQTRKPTTRTFKGEEGEIFFPIPHSSRIVDRGIDLNGVRPLMVGLSSQAPDNAFWSVMDWMVNYSEPKIYILCSVSNISPSSRTVRIELDLRGKEGQQRWVQVFTKNIPAYTIGTFYTNIKSKLSGGYLYKLRCATSGTDVGAFGAAETFAFVQAN